MSASMIVRNVDAFEAVSELPDACLDAIVTHPPYFMLADRDEGLSLGTSQSDYIDRLVTLFGLLSRALKPDGLLVFAMGDTERAMRARAYAMPWRVALALEDMGWPIKHCTTWLARGGHSIFFMGNGRLRYAVPSCIEDPLETVPGYGFFVWPESVVDLLLRAAVPDGGTVLDPFAGSGTVGIVAQRRGLNVILWDKDPSAYAIAKQRLEAEVS